ncbi:hypothetical protein BDF14DRAFT_1739582 [Spinellus fusiger]|nr:hypothetical protein BDF14DRAFT_1739582 [Spinellus fusiger]
MGLSEVCRTTKGITDGSQPYLPVGLNANIRLYRYRPGQMFQAHYDDSVKMAESGLWTGWTLLLYLNNVTEGGETVFYKKVTRKHKSDPLTKAILVIGDDKEE